jgi:leader peptidase (prepilin peptidase)/N-methyltransferase
MFGNLSELVAAWPFGVFALALGACVGSFLNVCIYRLPAQKSIVWPPSHCTRCLHTIAWYDNIPVVSYLWLGGKCRRCGATFSARYMIVEAVTGLLFFGYWLLYFRLGLRSGADHPGVYLVHMALVSALLVSAVIDFERKEIYTSVTNVALVAGVVGSMLWPEVQKVGSYDHALGDWTGWDRTNAVVTALVGAAVGAGLINVTRFLGTLAFRREAMGAGDAYLMGAVGACLGWEAALLVFLVAPFIALPYGLWQVLSRKKTEAPPEESEEESPPPKVHYGTFLATAAGFVGLVLSASKAGAQWGLAARVLLAAGLVAFGVAAWLQRREEDVGPHDAGPAPSEAEESHEVPYGPFLGAAAAIVMVIQDFAVAHFRPGLQAMVEGVQRMLT